MSSTAAAAALRSGLGWTSDPLLTYKVNAFTVAYAGSTHDDRELDGTNDLTQTSRQFFMKLQYLCGL